MSHTGGVTRQVKTRDLWGALTHAMHWPALMVQPRRRGGCHTYSDLGNPLSCGWPRMEDPASRESASIKGGVFITAHPHLSCQHPGTSPGRRRPFSDIWTGSRLVAGGPAIRPSIAADSLRTAPATGKEREAMWWCDFGRFILPPLSCVPRCAAARIDRTCVVATRITAAGLILMI